MARARSERLAGSPWLDPSVQASMDLERILRTDGGRHSFGDRPGIPRIPQPVSEAQSIAVGQYLRPDGRGVALSRTALLGAAESVEPHSCSPIPRSDHYHSVGRRRFRGSSYRSRRRQLHLYDTNRRLVRRHACLVSIDCYCSSDARRLQLRSLLDDSDLAPTTLVFNSARTLLFEGGFTATQRTFCIT